MKTIRVILALLLICSVATTVSFSQSGTCNAGLGGCPCDNDGGSYVDCKQPLIGCAWYCAIYVCSCLAKSVTGLHSGCTAGGSCFCTGPNCWNCSGTDIMCVLHSYQCPDQIACGHCNGCNGVGCGQSPTEGSSAKEGVPVLAQTAPPDKNRSLVAGLTSPVWVPRDAVFEKIDISERTGKPFLRLVIHIFSDGKFAWDVYIYEDNSRLQWDISKPTSRVIYDGKRRITVDHRTHSTLTYIMNNPLWAIKQITLQVNQKQTHEMTNVAPDRSLLLIPAGYVERTPSENRLLDRKLSGDTTDDSECTQRGDYRFDGTYFNHQLEKSFVYERVLPLPGNPRIEYDVYDFGLVVRTDFRGTEVKIITYDPDHMVRRVYDNVSKSVTTYPWLAEDTAAWRAIISVADDTKSPEKQVDEKMGAKFSSDPPAGYTERSPSETYLAYSGVVSQAPDERFLAATKEMDKIYNKGQEELAKRASTTCANSQSTPK